MRIGWFYNPIQRLEPNWLKVMDLESRSGIQLCLERLEVLLDFHGAGLSSPWLSLHCTAVIRNAQSFKQAWWTIKRHTHLFTFKLKMHFLLVLPKCENNRIFIALIWLLINFFNQLFVFCLKKRRKKILLMIINHVWWKNVIYVIITVKIIAISG